ncbi:T9SS type A sorting domain-containing protein [candidate division KSB1 bacterium]|nr:T9SS type A sorting domain-containing protein [candidate division KSB1 bacterium]
MITMTASGTDVLNAWIDFNGNGFWGDPGEQVFENVRLDPGENKLSFKIPPEVNLKATYARFRFCSSGRVHFVGLASDGEVEDYDRPLPTGLYFYRIESDEYSDTKKLLLVK